MTSRRSMRAGDRWAGYRILGRLGSGAEGIVYSARMDDDEIVALKVPFRSATTRIRFPQEVAMHSHLQTLSRHSPELSRTILPIISSSAMQNPHLATPVCADGSLLQFIAKHGPLAVDEALAATRRVWDMVSSLAAHGVWYHTIVAQNLLVVDSSSPTWSLADRLRLSDFSPATPISLLLQDERRPLFGNAPPRGLGWAFEPWAGSDYMLPFALLLSAMLAGEPLFDASLHRQFLLGQLTPSAPAAWQRAPQVVQDWLSAVIFAPPTRWPVRCLSRAAPSRFSPLPGITHERYAPEFTARLGDAAERSDLRPWIIPLRLPAGIEADEECLAMALFEQIRMQARLLNNEQLSIAFHDLATDFTLFATMSRLAPLLWARAGMLTTPTRTSSNVAAQHSAIVRVLRALHRESAPIWVVAFQEGEVCDAWRNWLSELSRIFPYHWIHVSNASALLRPTAPRDVELPHSPPPV